jgi:hypothetical protein
MKLIKAMAIVSLIMGLVLVYAPPDEPPKRTGNSSATLRGSALAEAASAGEDERDGVDPVWLAFVVWAVCWVVVITIEGPELTRQEDDR